MKTALRLACSAGEELRSRSISYGGSQPRRFQRRRAIAGIGLRQVTSFSILVAFGHYLQFLGSAACAEGIKPFYPSIKTPGFALRCSRYVHRIPGE